MPETSALPASDSARLLEENRRLKRLLYLQRTRALVGNSQAIQQLREQIGRVAETDAPVLIAGERGTGRSMIAQLVHAASPRAHRPLLRLDCSVLSTGRLARELSCEPTRDGGTLLLDQFDQLPPAALPMLDRLRTGAPGALRLLAVCGPITRSSTAVDSLQSIFLPSDSLQRLETTPLRDRRDDIAPLIEHFIHELSVREGRSPRRVALEVLELFEQYDWPGNERELQTVLARGTSLEYGRWITAEQVRPWLGRGTAQSGDETFSLSLREMERKLIETTFVRYDGNRERTAAALQIGLRTLSGKLREYGYPPRGGPGSNCAPCELRAA